MTKLEEKLIELGYEKTSKHCYQKETDYAYSVAILNRKHTNIKKWRVIGTGGDWNSQFNDLIHLQQDLEVLREYE